MKIPAKKPTRTISEGYIKADNTLDLNKLFLRCFSVIILRFRTKFPVSSPSLTKEIISSENIFKLSRAFQREEPSSRSFLRDEITFFIPEDLDSDPITSRALKALTPEPKSIANSSIK